MRLKIKPSAKINRRYLLLNGDKKDIEKTILDYIGVLGWARAKVVFVRDLKGAFEGHVILSVDRSELGNVRAAFELGGRGSELGIGGSGVGKIKVLGVSGTLKGLSKFK